MMLSGGAQALQYSDFGDILNKKLNRTFVPFLKNEPLYLEEKIKIFSRYGGFPLDYHKR